MMLIGPTLSGKSTYIGKNYPGVPVISRDEIVMELWGSRDYNAAFSGVDQKRVDRVLADRLREAGESGRSVIVDMTNMTVRRRMATLSHFGPGFRRVAVVFPFLSDEEYLRRNIERNAREDKWIPPAVIRSMVDSYQEPSDAERYDEVIFL